MNAKIVYEMLKEDFFDLKVSLGVIELMSKEKIKEAQNNRIKKEYFECVYIKARGVNEILAKNRRRLKETENLKVYEIENSENELMFKWLKDLRAFFYKKILTRDIVNTIRMRADYGENLSYFGEIGKCMRILKFNKS